jgi:hypothetical protein
MTVAELMVELAKLDPGAPVMLWIDEGTEEIDTVSESDDGAILLSAEGEEEE